MSIFIFLKAVFTVISIGCVSAVVPMSGTLRYPCIYAQYGTAEGQPVIHCTWNLYDILIFVAGSVHRHEYLQVLHLRC
jgi:hypothetical protein